MSLVHEYGIAPPLGKIAIKMSALQFEKATNGARPGEVTQILFGVVSLLRHLSIPGALVGYCLLVNISLTFFCSQSSTRPSSATPASSAPSRLCYSASWTSLDHFRTLLLGC